MFRLFDLQQTLSAFIVLFAVIDIIGSIPIIIQLNQSGKTVSAWKATALSFAMMVIFLVAGEAILKFFSVDIHSFAIAGSLIIFFIALEMLLDISIFKDNSPIKEATLVPLVFPLIAGAGSFTTLLTLRAGCASINIYLALVLNMAWVYIVLKMTDKIEKILGASGIYFLRKFFGVILLAIGVRLLTENLTELISSFRTF